MILNNSDVDALRSKIRDSVLSLNGLRSEVSSIECTMGTNAVKEELDSLTEAGYLGKKKKGRSLFFRANTYHPIFPELHSIVKKSLGIDRVIEDVREELGDANAVYILDDYALGKDSGLIEQLIVGDVRADMLQKYVRITEEKIKRKLRVIVLGVEEFEGSKGTFLQRPHWKVM